MVGVPSALHLAAGLVAVAVSAGLAVAIFSGALSGRAAGRRLPLTRDPARLLGVVGGMVYALSHALSGAVIGDAQTWAYLHAAGLGLLAVGAGPTRADRRAAGAAAPLLIPVAPPNPSYVAAGLGIVAAVRILGAGRSAAAAGLGVAAMGAAHWLAPTQPVVSEWTTLGGALLLGGWLWGASSGRILAKLLAAFVSALLALAILLSVVLSTVGTAQLTNDELVRLTRIAEGLTAEVDSWPAEAVNAASAIAIAPRPLLSVQLTEQEAADLYQVGFADQDFFLVIDATGAKVNVHPADLGGSVELALGGDPLVSAVRRGETPRAGGLLSTGGRIVAFGAVALRTEDLLPEDPPAGVLLTGRLVDAVWAEQQAATQGGGVIGVIAGTPAIVAGTVEVDPDTVVDGLRGRAQADLNVDGQAVFAASAPIADPETGTVLGQVVTTSSPAVVANLEAAQATRLFIVALAGGVLAVVVAALVTRRFTRPITELTAVAERIGAGDLSGRARIDTGDEVGLLGATFDEMVASLEAQRDELTHAARTQSRLRGRLESLTTSMSDGLIAVDADGLVIQFNPAAEAMTGLPAGQVLGQRLVTVLEGRVHDDSTSERLPGVGGRGDLQLEDPMADRPAAARVVLLRGDGDRLPVAVTAAPVRDDDEQVLGRVFVLRDISRDIEVERMKTEFLANVSHELRTPITPIKGYANVLARRDVGAEATRRFAGEILSSTERLERIVGMIVDFAGLDSGRVALAAEPVELEPLVAETLQDWRDANPGRVFGDLLNGQLPPVLADRTYLRRVLDELLDNAVKFSPDGDPVDVTAVTEGDRVRLSIVDRGIGIDPKAAAHLFTDFRQIDGTETRHYGGLGLGLGLVKRILDGTGARVEVESEPGVGATFSLLLPVGGPVPRPSAPLPNGPTPDRWDPPAASAPASSSAVPSVPPVPVVPPPP